MFVLTSQKLNCLVNNDWREGDLDVLGRYRQVKIILIPFRSSSMTATGTPQWTNRPWTELTGWVRPSRSLSIASSVRVPSRRGSCSGPRRRARSETFKTVPVKPFQERLSHCKYDFITELNNALLSSCFKDPKGGDLWRQLQTRHAQTQRGGQPAAGRR